MCMCYFGVTGSWCFECATVWQLSSRCLYTRETNLQRVLEELCQRQPKLRAIYTIETEEAKDGGFIQQ